MNKEKAMRDSLIGKIISKVDMPVFSSNEFTYLNIEFTDGTTISVRAGCSGCVECDPYSMGTGIMVEMR